MRRTAIFMILLATATLSRAEWQLFNEQRHGDRQEKTYVDMAVEASGRTVRFWMMDNYINYTVDHNESSQTQYEIDCGNRIAKTLQIVLFRGPMGTRAGTKVPVTSDPVKFSDASFFAAVADKFCR